MAHRCVWDEDDLPRASHLVGNTDLSDREVNLIASKVTQKLHAGESYTSTPAASVASSSPQARQEAACQRSSINHLCTSDVGYTQNCNSERELGSCEFSARLATLPRKDQCHALVDYYIVHLEPVENVVNRALFLRDFDYFWRVNEDFCKQARSGHGLRTSKMPDFWVKKTNWGFVALLFSVLRYTSAAVPEDMLKQLGLLIPSDELATLSRELFEAFMYFHLHSDYVDQPTLWTLQSMCLARVHMLDRLPARNMVLWHAQLVRLAQMMGLHRLGSLQADLQDPHLNAEPNDEETIGLNCAKPSFTSCHLEAIALKPTFSCSSNYGMRNLTLREVARKVWNTITRYDWMASVDHCYSIHETCTTTSLPANLDDDEVFRLDIVKCYNRAAIERKLDQALPTDATFARILYQIALMVRRQTDLENERLRATGSQGVDLTSLELIHGEYERILHSLPDALRLDGSVEKTEYVKSIHATRPYLSVQRILITEQLRFRMMKLHGSALVRGLREATYQHSALICTSAAVSVVSMHHELTQMKGMRHMVYYLRIHLLIAAIVLHLVLCFDKGLFNNEPLRDEIVRAVQCLSASADVHFKASNDFLKEPVEMLKSLYLVEPLNGTTASRMYTNYDDELQRQEHIARNTGETVTPVAYDELPDPQDDPLGWLSALCTDDQLLDFSSIDSAAHF